MKTEFEFKWKWHLMHPTNEELEKLTGFSKPDFWKRLLNIHFDNSTWIPGSYGLWEKKLAAVSYGYNNNRTIELIEYVIRNVSKDTVEIFLVGRHVDSKIDDELLGKAEISYSYVHDDYSAYDGLKNGIKIKAFLTPASGYFNDLYVKAYENIMSGKDFGRKNILL